MHTEFLQSSMLHTQRLAHATSGFICLFVCPKGGGAAKQLRKCSCNVTVNRLPKLKTVGFRASPSTVYVEALPSYVLALSEGGNMSVGHEVSLRVDRSLGENTAPDLF